MASSKNASLHLPADTRLEDVVQRMASFAVIETPFLLKIERQRPKDAAEIGGGGGVGLLHCALR